MERDHYKDQGVRVQIIVKWICFSIGCSGGLYGVHVEFC
jgi:hypothetical protein